MSIIDKKGKLFGKLNIIDLIAVILIVAVLALIGYKLLDNQSGGLSSEGQPVVYTVKVKGVEAEVYEFIKGELPSQLMASNELLDAYVTDVQAIPVENDTYEMVWNTSQSQEVLTKSDAGTYDLIFTIEGTVESDLASELGTQVIRVGKTHIVKTTTFELDGGIILSCERPDRDTGTGEQ